MHGGCKREGGEGGWLLAPLLLRGAGVVVCRPLMSMAHPSPCRLKFKPRPVGITPEQKTGRRDLSEVLSQTSNPYKDGRKLDDEW